MDLELIKQFADNNKLRVRGFHRCGFYTGAGYSQDFKTLSMIFIECWLYADAGNTQVITVFIINYSIYLLNVFVSN